MSHTCLTPGDVLALIRHQNLYPGCFPAALEQLGTCPECWQAIADLQGQPLEIPGGLRGPFTSLFTSLVTQEGHTASHSKALADVREGRHGPYRLLLEEGAAFLAYADLRSGQQTLLCFSLLLDHLPASPEQHDLKARAAVLAALFWGANGFHVRSSQEFQEAKRHRSKGTGDPELHATVLGAEAELSVLPALVNANISKALELVAEFPERRVELLFQFGVKLNLLGDETEAWEQLIEAENLAERYSPHLLLPIRSELLVLESQRGGTAPDTAERLFYLCLSLHHVCAVRGEALQEPGTLEGVIGRAAGNFSRLCLALAAGQPLHEGHFREAGQQLRRSEAGLQFFEGFFSRVFSLQKRFPEGQLSRELLIPLLEHMQKLEAA